jgi:hypothetical protein
MKLAPSHTGCKQMLIWDTCGSSPKTQRMLVVKVKLVWTERKLGFLVRIMSAGSRHRLTSLDVGWVLHSK